MDRERIWYKQIVRDELLNFIDRETSVPVHADQARDFRDIPVGSRGVIAYWQDDPHTRSTLPSGIIIQANEVADFFAWVATYLPIRPLTAYCRVIDSRIIRFFSSEKPFSFLELENCFLGIILAESVKEVGGTERGGQLSTIDSAGTLSFCLTRAIALGLEPDAAEWIERQWRKATVLIPDRKTSSDAPLVSRVFRLACALGSAPGRNREENFLSGSEEQIILRCAREIAETGQIQEDSWLRLTDGDLQRSRYLEIKRLPREDRIVLLRRIADSFSNAKSPLFAFVVGYLGSTIAPGTFDHYRTVLEFESKFPGALLWYGFCAGLYRGSDLQFFSQGLGRRIARELERADSIYSRPYCDVAISELEVLLHAPKPIDFRLGSPNTIEIELAPCVTTVRPFSVEKQIRRTENFDSLLRELDYKLLELNRLRSRIAHATQSPEQGALYGESSRERKK